MSLLRALQQINFFHNSPGVLHLGTPHIKGKGHTMFRLWAKIFENNHMLKDTVIEDSSPDTRTHKVFHALEEVCYQFDLGKPIWLDVTVKDFRLHSKTRFYQSNFIEHIDFDYLEIQIIEED